MYKPIFRCARYSENKYVCGPAIIVKVVLAQFIGVERTSTVTGEQPTSARLRCYVAQSLGGSISHHA